MKRDMDLVREILLRVQSKNDLAPKELFLDGRDELEVSRHAQLLLEAGILDGFQSAGYPEKPTVFVRDLTWQGHEFLAVLENEDVWAIIKKKFTASQLASMTFKALTHIGTMAFDQWAKQQMGA